MANLAGFDLERLGRRVQFLESRASAHLKHQDEQPIGKAYAATLLRDAACVSLLLGEREDARRYLNWSGHLLLQIGMLGGVALIALSTEQPLQELAEYQDVFEGLGVALEGGRISTDERGRRPMLEAAASSPRQLLSLMQGEWLMLAQDRDRIFPGASALPAALANHGGFPAGTTGISTATYAEMANWFSESRPRKGADMPDIVQLSLTTLALTRREHIRAAMRDTYHWRLMPRPAELVDLDTVVLCSLAIERGIPFDVIHRRFDPELPVADAPVQAALALLESRKPEPSVR